MTPKWHIIFGLLFSIVLFIIKVPILYVFVFFASAVLIDIDHYFYYAKKERDPSLSNALRWHYNLPMIHKPVANIFHSVEFFAIILLLSFFLPIFFFVFFGSLFHMTLDLIDMAAYDKWGTREFFFLRYLFSKNKGKYM